MEKGRRLIVWRLSCHPPQLRVGCWHCQWRGAVVAPDEMRHGAGWGARWQLVRPWSNDLLCVGGGEGSSGIGCVRDELRDERCLWYLVSCGCADLCLCGSLVY